jgi:hypothetical protein
MLKSSSIFKRKFEKNKKFPLSRFECFEHVILQLMKNIPKRFMTIQTIMFPSDLSNIKKCNFKECPFTQVAPLNVFLLGKNFNSTFLKLYMFEKFNFEESKKEKKNYKNVLYL